MRAEDHQKKWAAHQAKGGAAKTPRSPIQSRKPRSTRSKKTPVVGSVVNKLSTGSSQTDLMLLRIDSDLARIKNCASRQKKHEIQREILPHYADYLTSIMANPPGGDDPVLIQCMIWCFNLGEIEKAVALADHAIEHGLSMPEAFRANVGQFLCREVGYWALEQQKNDASPEPYLSNVFERSRDWDKPDQIEAVLLKAMGNLVMDGEPEKALEYFEAAAPLDDRIGVSQVIKRLNKQLDITESPAAPQEQQ